MSILQDASFYLARRFTSGQKQKYGFNLIEPPNVNLGAKSINDSKESCNPLFHNHYEHPSGCFLLLSPEVYLRVRSRNTDLI